MSANYRRQFYVILVVVIAVALTISGAVWMNRHRDSGEPETTPAPTERPIPTPEELTPEQREEYYQSSVVERDSTGKYANRVLSAASRTSGTLYVGTEGGATDALYLNPRYEPSEDEIADIRRTGVELSYGIYIKCEKNGLSWADESYVSREAGVHSYVISGQTYDTLTSADSVRWELDSTIEDIDASVLPHIDFRVVSLWDGSLVDVFRLDLDYDGAITPLNLYENDVRNTGVLREEDWKGMLEDCDEFISGNPFGAAATLNTTNAVMDGVIIDNPGVTYFPKLMGADGQPAAAGKFSRCEVYAVNIPQPGLGFITLYFAPESQLYGLSMPMDRLDLTLFGYDLLLPFSQEMLATPDEFAEYFSH